MSHYDILRAIKTGYAPDHYTALYARSMGGDSKEYERFISGELPLILSDSVGKPLVSWSITGTTVQDGEPSPDNPVEVKGVGDKTGNLFDERKVENGIIINAEGEININDNYRVSDKIYINGIITLTFNGTYQGANQSVRVLGYGTEGASILLSETKSKVQNYSYTLTVSENIEYIRISLRKTDINVMLNEGSTAIPYEPYGYKIPVVSRGKNLFDASNAVYGKRVTQNIIDVTDNGFILHKNQSGAQERPYTSFIVEKSGTYTVSCVTKQITGGSTIIVNYGLYVSDEKPTTSPSTTERTVTVTQGQYITFVVLTVSASTGDAEVSNVQIEYGGTSTEYEPYISPITTPIYLPSPIMADETLDSTGKREVELGKYEFTGDESFISTLTYDNIYYRISLKMNPPMKNMPNDSAVVNCSHLIKGRFGRAVCVSNFQDQIVITLDRATLGLDESITPTVNDFKSWLKSEYDAGHPVTVYYPLATPTSETVDVPKIPTLKGNTVLDVDTEVKPKNMEVIYKSSRR